MFHVDITRNTRTPKLCLYPIEYALTKNNKESENWSKKVQEYDPNPIFIPSYQRPIVWGGSKIKDFINSTSKLFGSVILVSTDMNKPIILLDGLQRFAVSTAILNYLYPLVLSPTPTRKDIADKFERLKSEIGLKHIIFEHNDEILSNHIRSGIKNSYKQLKENVKLVLEEELKNNSDKLIENIIKTFVKKQIAIDTYFGFSSEREHITTFININSTGMDLSEVDLLRSEIIQQANNKNWDPEDIDDMENNFTETFDPKNISWARTLGKNLYDAIDIDNDKASSVFPKWDSLCKEHVDDLLRFIGDFNTVIHKEKDGKLVNPYLYEILQCGHLPIIITFWYFYKYVHLQNKTPDFLEGEVRTNSILHLLLRVFYRKFIDGTIGRMGSVVTSFIQNDDKTIEQIINKINDDIGATELQIAPDAEWLKTSLRKSGTNRIRGIFNACLLPKRNDDDTEFIPMMYGKKKSEWKIDRLIPSNNNSNRSFGNDELNRIINFLPIPSNIKINKTELCSKKLSPSGSYSNSANSHPYVKWLTTEHYNKYADSIKESNMNQLDEASCLKSTEHVNIGEERIDKIFDLLYDKL